MKVQKVVFLVSTAFTVSVQKEASSCVVTPFCGRLNDCCWSHKDCYSSCCDSFGSCVEPKFCYTNLSSQSNLYTIPLTGFLTADINSTTIPFMPSNDTEKFKPCFDYFNLTMIGGVLRNNSITINPLAFYQEPVVFI